MKNDTVVQDYNNFQFGFEKKFDNQFAQEWMIEHWTDSVFYSGIYLLIIFGLQHLMKKRSALKLSRPLIAWNLFLATFSILAAYRTLPELFNILIDNGYYRSVCDDSFVASNKVTGTWAFLFILSKPLELIDTLFLVLRKRPLTFLHVYHHVTAIIFSWYCYKELAATLRWGVVMNVFVHSVMYTYFALTAMKYKPPKPIAIVVTSLQIIQMIKGFILNISVYVFKLRGYDCHVSEKNMILGLMVYFIFIFLFVRFFIHSYVTTKSNMKIQKKKE